VKRLVIAETARADLASIRRYSTRTWGRDQTSKYMDALRDTMKGVVLGTVFTRPRDDLRPAIQMATSGRHSIFFEADDSRILVVRVLHQSMDYRRHLDTPDAPSDAIS
jgi:toxin ParE1/3/4